MLELLENGFIAPEKRRYAFVPLPPKRRGGTEGDRDSFYFFSVRGIEFEIRICDPRPTYYLSLTSEQWDMFVQEGIINE